MPVSGSTAPAVDARARRRLHGLRSAIRSWPRLWDWAWPWRPPGLTGCLAELWTGPPRARGSWLWSSPPSRGRCCGARLSGMEVSLAACLLTAALVLRAREREAAARGRAPGWRLSRGRRPFSCCRSSGCPGRSTWRRAVTWLGPGRGLPSRRGWPSNLVTIGSPAARHRGREDRGGTAGARSSGVREPLVTSLVRPARPVHLGMIRWLWRVGCAPGRCCSYPASPGSAGILAARRSSPPACLLAHPPGDGVAGRPTGDPGFQEGRYFPFTCYPLVIATAVTPAGRGPPRCGPAGWWPSPCWWGCSWPCPGAASRYGWAVQNIEAMQVHLAHWVTDHTPAGRPARPQRRGRDHLFLPPRDRRRHGAGDPGHPPVPPGRGERRASGISSGACPRLPDCLPRSGSPPSRR